MNLSSHNNPEIGFIPSWLKLYITVPNHYGREFLASSPTTIVPDTESVDQSPSFIADEELSGDYYYGNNMACYLQDKLSIVLSQSSFEQLPYALGVINTVESAEKREISRRYEQLANDLKKVHSFLN